MRKIFLVVMVMLVVFSPAQQTNHEIDSLRVAASATANPEQAVQALAALSTKLYGIGRAAEAEAALAKGMALSRKGVSDAAIGALHNARGTLFFYKTRYDSAIAAFELALKYREKANDRVGALKSMSNVGTMNFLMGHSEKALSVYEDAFKLERELGFREGEHVSLNNIASVYYRLKLIPQAMKYYRLAEKSYANNSSALSVTYDGIASIYEEQNQLDSSLYYNEKSIALAEQQNDLAGKSYGYSSLGLIYKKQKKFDQAHQAFSEALRGALKVRDKRLALSSYGNLAAMYIERGDYNGAMVYLEKLIPLQKELNDYALEDDLASVFAEYYYRVNDYKKAYEYLRKYVSISDSMYNLNNSKLATEMQQKYETEKKERLNQLLQAENKSHRKVRNYLVIIVVLSLGAVAGSIIAYRKIKHSRRVISLQKELVDEKQKEILDSIRYAKRIQFALLASDRLLRTHLPEHFVFFRPKDVVSGDFYWGIPTPEGFIYVTGDCTGHGVPGAFMSLLNISKLSEVINEQRITRPDLILNHVRSEIIRALNPEGSAAESRDGMDAVVCRLNLAQMKLDYAAANNPFYIVRKGNLMLFKADKMPVGKAIDDEAPFTHREIALEPGDMIYTFTDGFADQFGGPMGKKFKYRQLEQLLLGVSRDDMAAQKTKIAEEFEKWKGSLEQIDDVCLIGVRV